MPKSMNINIQQIHEQIIDIQNTIQDGTNIKTTTNKHKHTKTKQ